MSLFILIFIFLLLTLSYFNNRFGDEVMAGKNTSKLMFIIATIFGLWGIVNPFIVKFFYKDRNIESLGQTGDWLGGSSVPLLTFASFTLLLATYQQQTEDLKITKKQSFENTIFQLLSQQHNILNLSQCNIGDLSGNNIATGKIAFENLVLNLLSTIGSSGTEDVQARLKYLRQGYETWYDLHENHIGHYLRNLYHIFDLIDSNHLLSHSEKKDFASLISSQLSSYELILIFYNSAVVKENSKFTALIKKYNILKHINFILLASFTDRQILKQKYNIEKQLQRFD
ncbi:putative phage abortive infection protein [Brevibacillus reuszeri]|uniref:putative phage abortive infection protein n=1 Tax=Brevibacillus reuszeri TaxID=54915 RepID=UPI00366E3EC2